MGQKGTRVFERPVEAGDVGERGEVSAEGDLSGEVAFGEVLALKEDEEGEGEEFGQGGLLMLLSLGEFDALGLEGL